MRVQKNNTATAREKREIDIEREREKKIESSKELHSDSELRID